MELLLDISNVNKGPIYFGAIAKHIKKVYLKRSEGLTFNDPDAIAYEKAAIAAGMMVGWYHFARPDRNSAKAEADHFASVVKGHLDPKHHLRPCLDFEEASAPSAQWARDFNHEFHKQTGIIPLFYSYPALIASMHLEQTIGDGLWLASYSRNDGTEHQFFIPSPWKTVAAHQFSSRCSVIGCPDLVDLSHVFQDKVLAF
jgi:lysozyme